MIVYTYDRDTGEYLDPMPVQKHPLRDEYLVPPTNTVAVAPPELGTNQVAKVNSNGDGWTVVVDYRGVVYYLPDGSKHEIDQLGTEPPQGALDASPPPPPEKVRADVLVSIDREAGAARARFATQSEFIESEYNRAYAASVGYIDSGYAEPMPPSVRSHVEAFEVSDEQAALEIKSAGDKWFLALDRIRDARLKGKQLVEKADAGASFESIAQPFLEQLKAIKP